MRFFILMVILAAAGAACAVEKPVSFSHDIRPVLSDKCFACHGPDPKKRAGDLRLDTEDGITQPLPKHPGSRAFVGGNLEKSAAWQRIISQDEKTVMPPPQALHHLSEAERGLIRRWILQGAKWEPHWAFQPLSNPKPPDVSDAKRCRNEVDRFLLAKLDEAGIEPAGEASKRTLIRRASLGLTGLPPTPDEVDAFVADASPGAYEKVVDRLLSSPRFGEKWARHWLDTARFAESHGFEQDYDRPHAYWFRDFVIRAFNRDLPYDQFVRWQLAGDELAPDDPWAMAATGFLGAGQFPTQLTEAEFEQARYDELDNMTATTGAAMLGLSIGCARCHDHKFDPITAKEYYRFASFFTTTIRSEIELDFAPAALAGEREAFGKEHASLVAALEKYGRDELPARFAAWSASRTAGAAASPWMIQDGADFRSRGGAAFVPQGDGSFLATGANADFDAYTVTLRTELTEVTAIRVEALAHASMVRGGPGRAPNGNFDLTNLRVTATPAGGGSPVEVKLVNARSTFDQHARLSVKGVIDAERKSGWAVDPQFGRDHAAAFDFEKPVSFPGGAMFTVTMEFDGNNNHNIGRPRIALGTSPSPALQAAAAPARPTIASYRQQDEGWLRLDRAVTEHAAKAPRTERKKVMVTSEGFKPMPHHADGRGFPHFYTNTFFLTRGDPKQKGDAMSPGFLLALSRAPEGDRHWLAPPPPGSRTSHRRAALASWISDTDLGAGGLLARVIVNRLWSGHFGRGIVSTPNDFGMQGAQPSHPELLEWLAGELVRSGWSLKHIHRLIVTSAAYREQATPDGRMKAKDAENRLLSHWPTHRLEAESLRDSMLFVSGQLDETMHGPGTLDANMKRRSIYFFIKRSQLVPALQLFDLPEPNGSVGGRVTTTIAPQALMFMNSPQVRGYAAAFAARLKDRPAAQFVAAAYRLALGRDPTGAEAALAAAFLEAGDREKARVDFCQTVLGLNEFAYVE